MFDRCPTSWIEYEGREVHSLASDALVFMKHGVLPHAGGMFEQSPKFLQALTIVSAMVGDS